MTNRILAVITIKTNSKRLPGKNFMPLGGIPLWQHTMEAAHNARIKQDIPMSIVISTDSPDIDPVSVPHGVDYVIPCDLKAWPVDTHRRQVVSALVKMEMESGIIFDWILTLQPTSPLRTAHDIQEAYNIARHSPGDVSSVVSVSEVRPQVWQTNGAIYLTRHHVLMESFIGNNPRLYYMPPERSVDIDTAVDFTFAEVLYEQNRDRRALGPERFTPIHHS